MSGRPQWKPPSVVGLAAVTVIPVAGVAVWGWNGLDILLLYWFENAIIGLVNLLRLILTRPIYGSRADYIAAHPWILQHFPMSEADWERAAACPVPRQSSHKEFIIPFFLGHYAFFLTVHAFLIATLVKNLPAGEWWRLFPAEWSGGMALAVASIAVSHAWRFWTEDLQGRAYTRSCPFLTMVYPYRRLLILHVALLLGGLAFRWFALPATLAVGLILLKAAFDMNWLRLPLGSRKMRWDEMDAQNRRKNTGVIVGETVTTKPSDSAIELTETADSLRFEISPQGIGNVRRKMRAGGCLVVGLVLLGFVSAFGAGLLANGWRFIHESGGDHYWMMLLVMTGTLLLGTVWLLMFAMLISVPWSVAAYGTVRGEIRLSDGRLRIRQQGFPIGRTGDFAAADIADLGMSPTGNRTNGFAVLQLRIRLRDGSEHLFLTGRQAAELNWIATRIMMRLAAANP